MHILPANKEGLRAAIHILRQGGIVAHATETCYGFACDLTNPEAVEQLFTLKQRPPNQPVSALFASIVDARKYVEWSEKAEELAKKYLPGPLTIILPLRSDAPAPLFATPQKLSAISYQLSATLGIRLSSHPVAQKLVEMFGSPLSTTSANLHGKPNTYSVEEILTQFRGMELQPDLVLDSGTLPRRQPSTVVVLGNGNAEVVRRGGIVLD